MCNVCAAQAPRAASFSESCDCRVCQCVFRFFSLCEAYEMGLGGQATRMNPGMLEMAFKGLRCSHVVVYSRFHAALGSSLIPDHLIIVVVQLAPCSITVSLSVAPVGGPGCRLPPRLVSQIAPARLVFL